MCRVATERWRTEQTSEATSVRPCIAAGLPRSEGFPDRQRPIATLPARSVSHGHGTISEDKGR